MITTINSTTASANASWPVETLAVIPVLLLLVLLLQRGLASGMRGPRVKWIDQAIYVALVPLALIFLTAAVMRVWSLLPR